jgi:transposase
MKSYEIVARERLVERIRRDGRSVYSRGGKRALIAACAQPGASVAAIAMAHGVNANLMRKWIARDQAKRAPRAAPKQAQATLLAIEVAPAASGGSAGASVPLLTKPPAPTLARAGLSIEIEGARIVVESAAIDRAALRVVIDCLRESASR